MLKKASTLFLPWVAIALSCGGGPAPASGQQPATRLGSPGWTETESEESREALPETAEAPRSEQCTGSVLDASKLANTGVCDIDGYAKALPSSVVASLVTDKTEVMSGQVTQVELVLHNKGAKTAELILDHSCGFATLITNRVVRDAHKQRLDQVGRSDCPLNPACAGQVAHFSLPPQGKATIGLPLPAFVSVIGEQCEELKGRALSAGNYTVQWHTPYMKTPLTTHLKVKELARLAKEKCKHYAHVVAKKAEPNIRQRIAVEKELRSTCEKEQPSQAFADCRMAATTEQDLASCQEVPQPR